MQMQSVPLVSGSVLRPVVDFLERSDGGGTLRALGRSIDALRQRPLVPFLTVGAACERAAREMGLPDLGLRIAEGARVLDLGELGELIVSAPTVGAALSAVVRSSARFTTGARYSLVLCGDEAHFGRRFTRAFERGRQEISDFGIRVVLRLIELAAGPGWRPAGLRLEGPPPAHAERLAALAERVEFGARSTAVIFPRAVLALPLPAFASTGRTRAAREVPSTDAAGSLRQSVEALVHAGVASLAAIAEAAGSSPRSLQRRLARAGQSVHALLDQARCRVAIRLLAERERKVIDVSLALGYSDAANFTRAFRRWTGVSPQEFRRVSVEVSVAAR